MRLAYNLGEVWSEDLLHQGYGGLHVICRLALARQDRADYYARKGIQVRQAVTLWEVIKMSLVQLKWKRPCTTIKWGIPARFVKMIFLGFKMFIFRDVVGCNAQKRLIWFFQKSMDDLLDPTSENLGRIRRGNGLLCKSPWKKTMRKRRLHILGSFSILFPSKTDGWLTSKYTLNGSKRETIHPN